MSRQPTTPQPAGGGAHRSASPCDGLAEEIVAAVLAEVPACRIVPEPLLRAAGAHAAAVAGAIAAGAEPHEAPAAGVRATAVAERLGLGIDPLLQACATAGRVALERIADGAGPERHSDLAAALWGWNGALMAAAVERGRDDARLLRALLAQPEDPVALRARALAAGLDPDAAHHVVRARVPRHDRSALVRMLAQHGLAAVRRDEVVALAPVRPPLGGDTLAGVARCDALAGFAAAHAAAGRALQTAVAFDLTGGRSLDQLGVLPAIAARPGLGARLRARHLDPLRREGADGDAIAEALTAWLSCDMHLTRAAAQLGLHPNTVHQRLRRFERLTGTRLDATRDRIELWWALQASALDRGRR